MDSNIEMSDITLDQDKQPYSTGRPYTELRRTEHQNSMPSEKEQEDSLKRN